MNKINSGKIIVLSQDMIDQIFEEENTNEDQIIALYKIVFSQWDNIASINGWPACNRRTSEYILEQLLKSGNGLIWVNKGFSIEDILLDWTVKQCDYSLR